MRHKYPCPAGRDLGKDQLYAVYSASLPLVFTPQLTTTPGTGKYTLDAAATGYTTKSIALVDISVTNQANVNFALVP